MSSLFILHGKGNEFIIILMKLLASWGWQNKNKVASFFFLVSIRQTGDIQI